MLLACSKPSSTFFIGSPSGCRQQLASIVPGMIRDSRNTLTRKMTSEGEVADWAHEKSGRVTG